MTKVITRDLGLLENVGGPSRDGKFLQKDINHTFLSANEQKRIPGPGNFLRIVQAASDLQIKIDDQPFVTRHKGHALRVSFREIVIKSAATQTVLIVVGFGWLDDNTSEFITSVGNVTVDVPINLDSVTDVTLTASVATAVLAANTKSQEVYVKAHPDNTENVRVGSAGDVGATKGPLLEPGEGLFLTLENKAIEGFAVGAGQKIIPAILEVA